MADTRNSPAVGADPRRWRALGVLALMQFMLVLDITVVNVALPHIRVDLGFSAGGLAWVVDAYVLMAGGLLLLGGRLSDLLGRRRMFLAGVTLFAVASALSGAAAGPGMLVAARFGQGAAEAMAAPAAFGLVALLFPDPGERAKAIGVFGGMAGLGGTLGPVISGLILDGLSWRWIFFINLPVAAVAVVAVRRLVQESRASASVTSSGRADLPGALLATSGLVAVVYGLIEAANHPWGAGQVLWPLAGGAGLLGLLVARERAAASPLVPLHFFANRTRVAANVTTLLFASVFFTVFYLLTLYLQQVEGYSALRSGIAYLPFGAAISLGIGLSPKVIGKLGFRGILGAGFSLAALGVVALSTVHVHGSYLTEVLPGMVVMGLGSGLCFTGFSNASVHQVTSEDASLASGVQTAMQQVGGAIGLAVLATLAVRHATAAAHHGASVAAASAAGTVLAYRIGAAILLAGAVVVWACFERIRPAEDATLLGEPLAEVA